MARNGTGTFVRLYNWVTDKINSVPITSSRMDAEMDGFATALSQSIAVDGQSIITQNIPFNSKKITGLASGTALTDSINVGQVQSGQFVYFGATGGDADNYTLTPSPTLTSSTLGLFSFEASATCNAAADMDISARGALNLHKSDGAGSTAAIIAGDIVSGQRYLAYDNATNIVIINPEYPIKSDAVDSDLLQNLTIAASTATNALTISLKTKADSDPSLSDPVKISFRSSTLTSGLYTTRSATAATSIVISSGSTLGTADALAADVYVYALDNAGTIELGVSTYLFPDNSLQSSTAEGGAGAADSPIILYSTTARTSVPIRLIGLINITQTTAGTWTSDATSIVSNPINYLSTDTEVYDYIRASTASSSASLQFINLTSQYSIYEFELINILPANNAVMLTVQYSTNNGSTWLASSYLQRASVSTTSDAEASVTNKTTGLSITGTDGDANRCPGNSTSKGGINGRFTLYSPSSAVNKQANWDICYATNTSFNYQAQTNGTGIYNGSTSAINAVQFIFKTVNSNTNNGNIASGKIILKGIK